MFSPSQTQDNPGNLEPDTIPDPCDWIQEHRSLAQMALTLSNLNHTLNYDIQDGEDLSCTPEGELVINRQTRDYLKANCGDRHWQYVQNYLSSNNI